jgi:hypothetical protein
MRVGLPEAVRACLVDLDGVLTRTARAHAAAWKQMFVDRAGQADALRRHGADLAVRDLSELIAAP